MAKPVSVEDVARALLSTLVDFNVWLVQVTIGGLAAYGLYHIFKDDDDTDAADETPERGESARDPPSAAE